MKHILICGGREYGRLLPGRIKDHPKRRQERKDFCAVMGRLAVEFGVFQVIHGGAAGADSLADTWLESAKGFPKAQVYKAQWKDVERPGAVIKINKMTNEPYDAAAGPHRNQKMVDQGKPDLVVAFLGGSGTADMVDRARKAGIEVREIK